MFSKLIEKYNRIALPAKASIWFVICSIIQKGIALITVPLFTRILTQEEYGTVSLYTSWMTIVTIFATLELPTGVFNKAMIKYEDDRDGYTSSSLVLSSLITLSLFIVYFLAKDFWNVFFGLNTQIMIMMFVEIFFTSAMSFWSIRQRFEYKYRAVVIVTLLSNFLATLCSLSLVILFPKNRAEMRILGLVLVHALIYAVVFNILLLRGKKGVVPSYWKYSVIYNIPLVPHYLSQQVLNQSDRIMISNICGLSDAAVYSLAYQIAVVMKIVTNAIHASFVPWTFQNIKKGTVKQIGKRAIQIEILIGLICLGFSLFAPEFIMIMGGSEYYKAVYIVPPVAMSVLFITIYTFFANIEFYFEKTKYVMIASCISALMNIILNAVFIPIFGFVAAGYTTLVCYIAYSIIHYLFMKKICKENGIDNPYKERMTWIIAAVFVSLAIMVSFVYKYTILRYVLILVVAVIAVLIWLKKKNEILGKSK